MKKIPSLDTDDQVFPYITEALFGIMYDLDVTTGKVKRTSGIKRILGIDAENAEEHANWWNNRIHPEDQKKVIKAFRTKKDHCEVEYRIRHSDGHWVYILDQAIIIRDHNRKQIRIIGHNIDISRHKETEMNLRKAWRKEQRMRVELERVTEQVKKLQLAEEEALRREREQRNRAEAANRAKDEFLANLSHELRSPLQSILGWIRLMRSSKLDPETASRALETIERNTKSQAQIINDLLEVSKFITGKAKIDLKQVDLKQAVELAYNAALPMANAKQVKLNLLTEAPSAFIVGDEDRLQQIFWNLLTNAVKFTPSGGAITVKLFNADDHVLVEVCDTGIGMDEEFLPFIFERLRQADSSPTKEYKGLGLGLSIVRHLVELHGGTITASSPGKGKGSTFRLSFLLQSVHSVNRRVEQRPKISQDSLAGRRILVLDDESDIRDFLSTLLNHYGAAVVAASSVKEALKLTQSFEPDIILSDLSLPEEDGYSFLRKLRAQKDKAACNTPIIALTARAAEAEKHEAISAGYNGFFCKPIEPDALIAAIKNEFSSNRNFNIT